MPRFTYSPQNTAPEFVQNGYKVAFLGDSNSGKTSLCRALSNRGFDQRYIRTVGMELHHVGNVQLWDVTGDYRFDGLKEGYVIGAEKVFIVLDCTKQNPNFSKWYNLALSCADPHAEYFVIITKIDKESRMKLPEQIENIPIFEVSSKSRDGLGDVRQLL